MRPLFEHRFEVPTPSVPPIRLKVPGDVWPRAGTLCVRFHLTHDLWPSACFKGSGRDLSTPFLNCPVFQSQILAESFRVCLRSRLKQAVGKDPVQGNLDLCHLRAGQTYHLAFAWDASHKLFECYVNGLLQCILFHTCPPKWSTPATWSGPITLGGKSTGEHEIRAVFEHIELFPTFLDPAAVTATFGEWKPAAPDGEARMIYFEGLDLSAYRRELIHQTDFSKPLNLVHEKDLFEDGKRIHVPEGGSWVLEGEGAALTEGGRLILRSAPAGMKKEGRECHLVLWHQREYPADLLIEYDFSPQDSQRGLHLIFFAARSKMGGTIFATGMPFRDGEFPAYHSGELNCYQVSMWSNDANRNSRRVANLRKHAGFFIVAIGPDLIAGHGPGPHHIRILKVAGRIQLETNGVLCLDFQDDGSTYGPVLQEGAIGLRTMQQAGEVSFSNLSIHRILPR